MRGGPRLRSSSGPLLRCTNTASSPHISSCRTSPAGAEFRSPTPPPPGNAPHDTARCRQRLVWHLAALCPLPHRTCMRITHDYARCRHPCNPDRADVGNPAAVCMRLPRRPRMRRHTEDRLSGTMRPPRHATSPIVSHRASPSGLHGPHSTSSPARFAVSPASAVRPPAGACQSNSKSETEFIIR